MSYSNVSFVNSYKMKTSRKVFYNIKLCMLNSWSRSFYQDSIEKQTRYYKWFYSNFELIFHILYISDEYLHMNIAYRSADFEISDSYYCLLLHERTFIQKL